MRLFKRLIYSLFFASILPVCLAAFLLMTTPGLRVGIMVLNLVLPGKLKVENLQGRLIDRFSIGHLTYTSQAAAIDVSDLAISWQLNHLLKKKLTITQLQMLKLQVKIANSGKAVANSTKKETTLLRSPITIDLNEATINLAQIQQADTVHQVSTFKLQAYLGEQNWQINQLNFIFAHTFFSALANGTLAQPHSIKANVQFKPIGVYKQQFEGFLTLGGDETFYHWQGKFTKPLNLQIDGSLGQNLYTFAKWQEFTWQLDKETYLDSPKGSLRVVGQIPNRLTIQLSADLQKPFEAQLDSEAQTTKQGITATGNIKLPQGSASINLRGMNIYNEKYQWQANITLPDLTLLHPDLKDLKTTINAQANASGWNAQGSIIAGGKTLSLVGKGNSLPQMTGSVTMEGQDVPLIDLPDYKISFSPQLALQFKPEGITLRGNVLIPNALIKPENFNMSQSLTDDVVFVGEDSATKSLPIDSDITVTMGDRVGLSIRGITGFLTGSIRLRQIPPGPLNGTGELTIREGKYHAYGQNLAIEQGQLLFTGGLLVNPGIHVRATRQFKNTESNASTNLSGINQLFDFNTVNLQNLETLRETTVGIEVTGRLKAPKVKLFSTPSTLSQADILSMLILGRPANQASQSGGQLLLTAISALNLDSGTSGVQLLTQLKQRLGFDINFQTNTQYNRLTNQVSENQAVVVKKAISKRLILSYNFGLTQADVNVLTLTYLLNKFFSIQVNASDNNSSLDVLYNHYQE